MPVLPPSQMVLEGQNWTKVRSAPQSRGLVLALMFGFRFGLLRFDVRLVRRQACEILNGFAQRFGMVAGHLRFQLIQRDTEVFRYVLGCEVLAVVLESACIQRVRSLAGICRWI